MQGDTPPTSDTATEEPSAIVRNLGMIKAASVIMGILIIILGAVVVATVISRLSEKAAPAASLTVSLPDGVRVISASADGDGMTLLVEGEAGQEIWRLSPAGERYQTITLEQK